MTRYAALIDGTVGAYGVTFPDLPGCTAMGQTPELALAHAADSLREWIELTAESGAPVPDPRPIESLRSETDLAEALAAGSFLATIPLIRHSGKPVKANLSLDSGILDAIDAEAKRRKLTRSAFVETMAREMLAAG